MNGPVLKCPNSIFARNESNLGESDPVSRAPPPSRRVITVDVKQYEAWLDSTDLTPAQKAEFIEALWSIVMAFVELGFGVHPLQVDRDRTLKPDGASKKRPGRKSKR